MTKKRKRYPDLLQKLERPWCYYCERDFDDLKILLNHQKAKHFKCDRCARRLNTAGGLSVHMSQVHKETLSHVENALPGRQSLDIEIFGMEGVPEDVVEQHNQQVTHKHFEEENERARVTGNPVRGLYSQGAPQPGKRVKVKEDAEEVTGRAAKYRQDIANGVLPVQPVGATVELPPQPSPPVVPPYGAPPPVIPTYGSPAPPFAPPGAPQGPPGYPPPAFAGAPPFGQVPSPVNAGMPPRPGSIPAPGALPQRPPYGYSPAQFAPGQNGNLAPPHSAIAASVDELISSAAAASAAPAAESAPEKKSKKDKNIKLVYFDESVSPEEKMAALPRYASAVQT